MPGEDSLPLSPLAADPRQLTAMGERVTRVETKLESMDDGIKVIRATLHAQNNKMQEFVLLEAECVAALKQIVIQTSHLPDLLLKITLMDELRPKIVLLLDDAAKRKGAWGAYVIVGSALVGLVTIATGLAAAMIWLWNHGGK